MILLELTEQEAEMIEISISVKKFVGEYSRTENEKFDSLYESVMKKIHDSTKPQPEVLITMKDLQHIKSLAPNQYLRLDGDIHISDKKVEQSDFKHIALANSMIMWLNNKNLLKKPVKFDFTDQSNKFEGED